MKIYAAAFAATLLTLGTAAWADEPAANEAGATEASLDIASLRLALAGTWEGELAYLDYQSGEWFGLPMDVTIEDAGDGVTIIRKSDYNDGPAVGNVRIVSTAMFDPENAAEYVGTFRAGRPAELATYTLSLESADAADSWTMIATTEGTDGGEPARIRETTVRDGDTVTTLKEVDPANDGAEEWITRNRTTLTRLAE